MILSESIEFKDAVKDGLQTVGIRNAQIVVTLVDAINESFHFTLWRKFEVQGLENIYNKLLAVAVDRAPEFTSVVTGAYFSNFIKRGLVGMTKNMEKEFSETIIPLDQGRDGMANTLNISLK